MTLTVNCHCTYSVFLEKAAFDAPSLLLFFFMVAVTVWPQFPCPPTSPFLAFLSLLASQMQVVLSFCLSMCCPWVTSPWEILSNFKSFINISLPSSALPFFHNFHFLQLFAYFHPDRVFISILTYLEHKLSSFCSISPLLSPFQLMTTAFWRSTWLKTSNLTSVWCEPLESKTVELHSTIFSHPSLVSMLVTITYFEVLIIFCLGQSDSFLIGLYFSSQPVSIHCTQLYHQSS